MALNRCEHVYSAASRRCILCNDPVFEDGNHRHLWDFDSHTCVLCGAKDTDAPAGAIDSEEGGLAEVIPLRNPAIEFKYVPASDQARTKARTVIGATLVPMMQSMNLQDQLEGQLIGLTTFAVEAGVSLDVLTEALRFEYAETLRCQE